MSNNLKNKIRASFLLAVFSLNIAAGFACSVGIDLGYNKHHHEDHDKISGHHHQKQDHHQEMKTGCHVSGATDDCCSGDVVKFALLDKSAVTNVVHQLQAPFLILTFSAVHNFPIIKEPVLRVNSDFQFVRRSCFLNDTDPQIAIRRFQI